MGALLIKVMLVAGAIGITASIVPGIEINGGLGTLVWVSLLFTVVNLLLKPLAQLVALPLILVTLGLFALVVNAGMLLFTAWLTEGLDIDGFWPALWGSILISLVLMVAEAVLDHD